uniref:Uncharacterized protein n=1 Tax=Arundo donax TaxID=35708 RepID=A0A0A9F9K8_ARUDO
MTAVSQTQTLPSSP